MSIPVQKSKFLTEISVKDFPVSLGKRGSESATTENLCQTLTPQKRLKPDTLTNSQTIISCSRSTTKSSNKNESPKIEECMLSMMSICHTIDSNDLISDALSEPCSPLMCEAKISGPYIEKLANQFLGKEKWANGEWLDRPEQYGFVDS